MPVMQSAKWEKQTRKGQGVLSICNHQPAKKTKKTPLKIKIYIYIYLSISIYLDLDIYTYNSYIALYPVKIDKLTAL